MHGAHPAPSPVWGRLPKMSCMTQPAAILDDEDAEREAERRAELRRAVVEVEFRPPPAAELAALDGARRQDLEER